MLQIFTYCDYYSYGVECGIIIAESKDEAITIARKNVDLQSGSIPLCVDGPVEMKKGYIHIGDYDE